MTDPVQDTPDLLRRLAELEADLQTSRQHATAFFAGAPAPSFLLDADGRLRDVNPAACALLGRTREALIGQTLGRLAPPAAHSTLALLLRSAFEDGLRHDGEARFLHADGSPIEVRLDLVVDGVAGGTVGGERLAHLVATDVTPYKDAHRGLLDATAAQERQLQQSTARVRALQQELDEIVTTFLRQLHPPLAHAMDALTRLRAALDPDGGPGDAVDPFLDGERAVQQVIALLASMDRFMQMRSMRVTIRPVDLNAVLAEVLRNAQPVLADRDVAVTGEPLPTVPGDSRALYLVLDEYVANALKFTKNRPGARVRVFARDTDTEHVVGVEDNGAGFNMRQKDQLFRLFGRLHPSGEYEGTGVGLVTVRRTCERFGGRVWAEGRPGVGATFWFAWPKRPTLREG